MKFIEKENKDKALVGFDGTPVEVMKRTLKFLQEGWRSVEIYLHSVCGFKFSEQHKLRKALLALTETQRREMDRLFPHYKRQLKAELERVDKKGVYIMSRHGKKIYLKNPVFLDPSSEGDQMLTVPPAEGTLASCPLAFILVHRRNIYRKGGPFKYELKVNGKVVPKKLENGCSVLIALQEEGEFRLDFDMLAFTGPANLQQTIRTERLHFGDLQVLFLPY